jgi:hypothetical protein
MTSCTISYVYVTVRYRMLTYDIVCTSKFGHRMLVTTLYIYILCSMFDVRHFMSVLKAPSLCQLTLNSQKTPAQGVCIWPVCLLHLALLFRPCKQCWLVRNTVILHKKWLLSRAIWMALDQWTVQTPSLVVREPCCTIPGHLQGWLNYNIIVLYPISLYSDIDYTIIVQLWYCVFHYIV